MLKDFKALKISIASPQQILNWSHGEVKKAETINYRTHRAEVDGLMDEKIFGPTKNYECYCGKYKKIRYKGIICDKCGVEVTHKRVRRERLGHIKLACPVTHIWFSYGVPNKLSILLDIPQKKLNTVIYFSRYIVTQFDADGKEKAINLLEEGKDKSLKEIEAERKTQVKDLEKEYKEKEKDLKKKEKDAKGLEFKVEKLQDELSKEKAKLLSVFDKKIDALKKRHKDKLKLIKSIKEGMTLSEEEHNEILMLGIEFFEASMGAEAVKKLLAKVDLEAEIKQLKEDMTKTRSKLKISKIIKRRRILEGMLNSGIDPTWIVLDYLPVLPPDLRPIIQLPGGRFATSDLNDLYRRVINRNNRLKRLIDLGAPEIILRNEKRMLQESVDALIDNSHRPGNAVNNSRNQPYKSLSDMLRGKQGRFRQNLLGKRVDFSGRSVIISGPNLSVNECGLPKEMALELFKPFVIHEIIARGFATNIKSAKNLFEEKTDEVWDILEDVIEDRPVLLNRAPTLHKQGIQAFFPVLIEGNAIQLHPLVCKGFNADFDGDQMAVHVPLSEGAIEEVKERMFPKSNILLMADGKPVITTQKDMAFGVFYLTGIEKTDKKENELKAFSNFEKVIGAYNKGAITLREPIRVLHDEEIMVTTAGRIIFNRTTPEGYEYVNFQVGKKGVAKLSARILEKFGNDAAINFLDQIEKVGFEYATKSGYSISMNDFKISDKKDKLLEEIEAEEEKIMQYYENGFISKEERKRLFEQAWLEILDKVAQATWEAYDEDEDNLMILNKSGAAPVENPLKQIAGVRGLILDPMGKIVELPLRSNYKEGLSSLEYFVAARGTRKALADVALKTAESGYLTRKLVDVAQDVIIREEDCGTEDGIYLSKNEQRRVDFVDRIAGRWTAEEVKNEQGEVLVAENGEITTEIAELIAADEAIEKVKVRSILTCESTNGVCAKCYGYNLGTRRLVENGLAVGVIAAQAMGEASTQLTLDAKHRSGSATAKDITRGLPRIEELVEVRTPKGKAELAEISGKVSIKKDEERNKVEIKITNKKSTEEEYDVSKAEKVNVKKAKNVSKNTVMFVDEDGEEVKASMAGRIFLKDNKLTFKGDAEEEEIYELNLWAHLLVEDGDTVEKGQPLMQGSLDPDELMQLRSLKDAQKYIIDHVQNTYGIQGIGIDDKHVEIVIRQMSRFVMITNPGESDYLPGDYAEYVKVKKENEELKAAGKKPIKSKRQLLGLTQSSLKTESFLSAASFQDQVRVLSTAAILGKSDDLNGLKENVIIGRLVPLGDQVQDK